MARLILALLCAVCAPFAYAQAVDPATLTKLTAAQATIVTTSKSYNRVTKESLYELSFTNASGAALRGPVYVMIEGLGPSGVTVKNATGLAAGGVSYFVISATDVAAGASSKRDLVFGNPNNARITFTPTGYLTPPPPQAALQVQITSPGTLITVGSTPLLVKGTINDPSATLTVNGAPVSHSAGTFQTNVALIEGHNSVIARATNSRNEEATATISVSLDLTPPYVTIESPKDGAVVTSSVISVSGLINDIVRGTVSEGQANVTVNGRAATVANRSYLAQDVPLQEGVNTIRVQASDQVGNTGALEIHVTYEVPTTQFVELAGGQGQKAQIRETLPQSLRVKLLTAAGAPVPGKPVIFRVTQGDGVVGVGGSDEGVAVLVTSNSTGEASTRFKVGSRAGSGNNRVSAKAVGFEGEVVFVASADPKPGNKVSVNSGNNQRGAAKQPLPLPFVTVVTDDGANVIAGAQVEYKVTAGGGKFQNGQSTYVATTDSDGRANAKLTLGEQIGLDVHRVTATLVGTGLYAGFTASALQGGAPGATSISGVVLDNQDHPLPNVTMRVEGTTREARTDVEGRFKITEVPVGPVHLIADGSTTTAPGEWPTLPYNIVTIAGADNPLSAPVYMVKLDTARAVTVGAADKEITVPELPGFKLTVKAGSVTFPNGDRVGKLSVTPVNASKIPMAPPNGMQPQLIVTIQPTGARFDPPAPLQLPNVDGHAPGAQVEMYSFDHDLEEFVSIGLGTVSADGTVIASNPGIGVIKAGWHCGSQPTGNGCAHNCPVCQDCDGNCNCVNASGDPRLASLDADGDCKAVACEGGAPKTSNDDSDVADDPTNGDCKKPGCSNGSATSLNDDTDKPDATSSPDDYCKTCSNGSLVPDPSKNTQITPTDKCKECKDGSAVDIEKIETVTTVSYTYGWPSEAIDKINKSLEKLTNIGVIAKVSGPSVQGTLQGSQCCEPTLGKGTKLSGSITGTLVTVSIKGKLWPLGPIPTWDPPPYNTGLFSFDAKAQFIGGIFAGVDLGASGMLGYKKDPCSEKASDRDGCVNAEAAITLTPKFSVELGGEASLNWDCLFLCDETTITLAASFIFGEIAFPITMKGVSYNKEDCDAGGKGGELEFNPAELKVGVRLSGSYQKAGEASHTIDVSFDFLKCDITLSKLPECNL